jgi:hypothetical protein
MRRAIPLLSTIGLVSAIACAAPPEEPPPKRPPGPELVMPGRDKPAPTARPADLSSLRRLVRQFDFEDPERFPTEMPRDWYRLLSATSGRPGYPDFGTIALSDRIAREGKWSLEFALDGGSMATALPPGIIRIFPGSRYRVSVWIRTERLQQASASMVVRLHDRDGRATGEEYRSQPLRSEGEWTQVRIDLPEVPAFASDLSLELEVTQPSSSARSGERRVGDDLGGRVWFDGLEIWQIPAIRFGSRNPAQVFTGDAPREIEIELRDLVSDELTADITVRDIDGVVVHESRMPLPGAGALVRVPLPDIGPGAYTASLAVAADGIVLARRTVDISILDDHGNDRTRGASPRFGVLLPAAPDEDLPLMRAIVREVDPDFVVVPAWPDAFDAARATARIAALRDFVDALLDGRVEPVLAITSVPAALAAPRHLDAWQALDYFGADDAASREHLEPWLLAFGQHVERWQIGETIGPAAREPLDREEAMRVRAMLDERVAGPILIAPAEADWVDAPPPPGIARHVRIPWSARPSAIADHLEPWRDPESIVAFELAPSEFPDRTRIDDLAVRALYAWRLGVRAMAIDLAWKPAVIAESQPASLRSEALAWRELGRTLSGRTFAGELPLPEGIRGWIADGANPALILWSDEALTEGREVAIPLGNSAVEAVDLLGRRSVISPSLGAHRVTVMTTPLVIEGIDAALLRTIASARMEPAILESRRSQQDAFITLHNHFGVSMGGSIVIADQESWEIAPRQQQFSIPAGAQGRIPVRIGLPRSTPAGPHALSVRIEWVAGESHTAEVPLRLAVDWTEVEVRSNWRFARSVETGRVDVVATVSVTNRGAAPMDLEAFALARDYSQTRRPILKLGPGETAIRVFQFPDGARRLSGASIYAGVTEMEGDRRLTQLLAVPPFFPRPSEPLRADATASSSADQ